MIVRMNIIVNRILSIESGSLLRLAIQSDSNTATAVFVFHKY